MTRMTGIAGIAERGIFHPGDTDFHLQRKMREYVQYRLIKQNPIGRKWRIILIKAAIALL